VVQDGDFPSTDHNGVPRGLAKAGKGAVDAVVLEQVGQGPGIGQVVDGHDLDLGMAIEQSEQGPSDPSETVDAYAEFFHFGQGG